MYLFQGDAKVLHQAMQELIDRFALEKAVRVVVGGNRISFDHLPLIVGEQVGHIYEILDRISVSRAETCYQMQDVLGALQPDANPLVVTDMLASFYEEDLTTAEVSLLLKRCLKSLAALGETAPVLISACGDPTRPNLLDMLEQSAGARFYFQPLDTPPESQLSFTGMG